MGALSDEEAPLFLVIVLIVPADTTTTALADGEAWREGAADDMVFAVAVVAFVAEDLYSRVPAAPTVELEVHSDYC